MRYKDNWEETQRRFKAWWRGEKMDRPLLKVTAKRKTPLEALEPVEETDNYRIIHLDVERRIKVLRNYCRTHRFLADSFPFLDINIGPGSMATYLGAEPVFDQNTIWYKECIRDWEQWNQFRFDPETYWWKHHIELMKKARELSKDDFLIGIPDIQENIDILSAMRGPQMLCYDLIDEPEAIKAHVKHLDEIYFRYYDPMYDILKLDDGSSCYTAFSIWGPGKTGKVQCDFSSMMSPPQFREFVVPSIREQCRQWECSLYHLDGPDAVRHLDALMEIDELDVLQWTPGAGKPDGGDEEWYHIYEKVKKAGKALWISLDIGTVEEKIQKADKLVKTFGNQGWYFIFTTPLEEEDAGRIVAKAEDSWT